MYKTLIISALSIIGFTAQVQAADTVRATQNTQYRDGTQLDIATIISQTSPAATCDITPVKVTYLDSKGIQHSVEYSVFGNGPGCGG